MQEKRGQRDAKRQLDTSHDSLRKKKRLNFLANEVMTKFFMVPMGKIHAIYWGSLFGSDESVYQM